MVFPLSTAHSLEVSLSFKEEEEMRKGPTASFTSFPSNTGQSCPSAWLCDATCEPLPLAASSWPWIASCYGLSGGHAALHTSGSACPLILGTTHFLHLVGI